MKRVIFRILETVSIILFVVTIVSIFFLPKNLQESRLFGILIRIVMGLFLFSAVYFLNLRSRKKG
jgi:hypothetical protein